MHQRVRGKAAVQRKDALDGSPAKGDGDALRGGLEVLFGARIVLFTMLRQDAEVLVLKARLR